MTFQGLPGGVGSQSRGAAWTPAAGSVSTSTSGSNRSRWNEGCDVWPADARVRGASVTRRDRSKKHLHGFAIGRGRVAGAVGAHGAARIPWPCEKVKRQLID